MAMFEPPQSASSYAPLQDEKGEAMFQAPSGALGDDDEAKKTTMLKATIANRPSFAHVSVTLGEGDCVVSDYGAMLWINSPPDGIAISTGCYLGGCCSGYWRTLAREACCMNKYTGITGEGEVAFGFDLPGDILPFMCPGGGDGWVLTKGGFVCGTENICLSSKWKGCSAYCCSGEGGMLTHVKSSNDESAVFFAGGFGAIQAHQIQEGQQMYVNTGLFFAANDQVGINVSWPGGCKSYCYSGEGWVMSFQGPNTIYTQSRDPDVFMALLNPKPIPQQGGGGDGGDGGGGE